jgi:hypothetical protein
MKIDGRLERNFLAGTRGDAANALLCGAGYNLRLILNWLRRLLRALLQLFAGSCLAAWSGARRSAVDPRAVLTFAANRFFRGDYPR